MTRFKAIFVKVNGLDETDAGDGFVLSAETRAEAEDEALALPVPAGANVVKILDEGRVVTKLGIEL